MGGFWRKIREYDAAATYGYELKITSLRELGEPVRPVRIPLLACVDSVVAVVAWVVWRRWLCSCVRCGR